MIKEEPGARIRFDYEIRNETGILLHVGYTVLVFISAETKRIIAFPESIKKALGRFFEKSPE
jgi:acyl-CoA thioesterase FadM